MSTELLENKELGVYLNRFFGGAKRGRCYQITLVNEAGGDRHIQLTEAQMDAVVEAYQAQ
jgi:hypothetical protein